MSEPTGPTPNPYGEPAPGQAPQQGVPYPFAPPSAQPSAQPPYPQPGYQQAGYPPPGYQQPGYQQGYPQPGQPPYAAGQRPGRPAPPDPLGPAALKLAVVALVIAVLSIASVGIWTTGAVGIAGAAIGLGLAGVNRPGAKGPAIAGIATGTVAMLLAVGLSVFLVADTESEESDVIGPVETADEGTGDDTKGDDTAGDDTGDDTGTSGLADVLAPRGALANGGIPVGASGVAGVEVPDDAVVVSVYLDYMCPYCAMFEETNAMTLAELRAGGTVIVAYHPVSILDRLSMGTGYSTRAATAAALVADQAPEAFDTFNTALFANQPGENTEGLTDAAIADIATGAGVPEEVATAISSGAYLTGDRSFVPWVAAATQEATLDLGRLATPAIVIDGVTFTGDWSAPGALKDAVDAARG